MAALLCLKQSKIHPLFGAVSDNFAFGFHNFETFGGEGVAILFMKILSN
jgi:hypothetical protein